MAYLIQLLAASGGGYCVVFPATTLFSFSVEPGGPTLNEIVIAMNFYTSA